MKKSSKIIKLTIVAVLGATTQASAMKHESPLLDTDVYNRGSSGLC